MEECGHPHEKLTRCKIIWALLLLIMDQRNFLPKVADCKEQQCLQISFNLVSTDTDYFLFPGALCLPSTQPVDQAREFKKLADMFSSKCTKQS